MNAYDIETEELRITNHGEQFFYPHPKLAAGLEELVIFPENATKRGIPNGSLWKYKEDTPYNPAILQDDVGCGITAYLHEPLPLNADTLQHTSEILATENLHIGGGNHFINLQGEHPLANEYATAIIHSDMNWQQTTPQTFDEAKQRVKEAEQRRQETMEHLLSRLGVQFIHLHTWVHNNVQTDNGGITYTKGVINTEDAQGQGLLLTNPYEPQFLYLINEGNTPYMQHGTGKKTSKGTDHTQTYKHVNRHVMGMLIRDAPMPRNLYEEFQPPELFLNAFGKEIIPVGNIPPGITLTAR